MRHGLQGRKLNRTSAHRKALFANLATELLRHGQIKTTLPKAKDLRRVVEPLITKARCGDLAARREVAKTIRDKDVLKRLFDDIAPMFKDRPGGFTRVLKMGFRQGDAAPMALIELTEKAAEAKPAAKQTSAKKEEKSAAAPEKVEKKEKAAEKKAKKPSPEKAE